MEIVINKSHTMFWLSEKGIKRYAELKGRKASAIPAPRTQIKAIQYIHEYYWDDTQEPFRISDIKRNDPALIQTIKELGKEAVYEDNEPKIIEIPDDVEWEILNYYNNFDWADGTGEWVGEKHRIWR